MVLAANTTTNTTIERKNQLGKVPLNVPVAKKLEDDSFYNVLNKYRSYNYNFTLAPLPKQVSINDYASGKPLDNIILKSSGKAVKGVSPDFQMYSAEPSEDAKKEVDTFNKNSPGKFDLYINNVEIETLPLPSSRSGNTVPTRIKFDVYEPYSVIGFLEALRAAAVSSGYSNYLEASFILKIEFIGYKDSEDLPTPELVPQSTRYLKIKFSAVDVDVGITGTVYKCTAIPVADLAFSNLYGSLKYSIQMSGNTVWEILKDMIRKINENNLTEAKKRNPDIKSTDIDQYKIFFPNVSESNDIITLDRGNTDNPETEVKNEIAKSLVRELSADNVIYQFENVGETNKRTAYQQTGNPKEYIANEPSKIVVNFAHSSPIHEIISSVIRDSTYWTDQCDPETGSINKEVFKFWRIKSDVKFGKYSTFLRREVTEITYDVVVDEVHSSMLPPNQAKEYNPEYLNILREYNYIYTGQNVDVLDVKINFNRLFYERTIVSMGNNDKSTAQGSDKAGNTTNVIVSSNSTVKAANTLLGGVPVYGEGPAPDIPKEGAGNAGPPTTNLKSYLAKDYYDILLSDSASMIEIDLQIIGDPVYLVSETRSIFQKRFSNYIKLYFRNPVDVDETDLNEGGTGLLKFSNKNIQFSGIYLIKNVVSNFRDGMFRQTLKLLRQPFVIDENDYKPEEVNAQNIYKTIPKPGDQTVASTGQSIPQNKISTFGSLISGVNNIAESIQAAEARIVGAVQGAVSGVASAAAQAISPTAKSIREATNSIQGKLQGINDTAVDAANKFGLTPTQLSSLSAKELLTVIALSKTIPSNVNMSQLEQNGVVLPSTDSLTKVPAVELPFIRTGIETETAADKQKIYEVAVTEIQQNT